MKFHDKIVNISQGDILLSQAFLDSMLETIYPSAETISKKQTYLGAGSIPSEGIQLSKEAIKQREQANATISLACTNLWQTIRSRNFNNLSKKGNKLIVEWIFNKLLHFSVIVENNQALSADQMSKLSLIFDTIQAIGNGES